jgi:peptidoglycan/LPS O-acetylase OafA/YrhL
MIRDRVDPTVRDILLSSRSSFSPIDVASLDFLRGVAAIYVVINHIRGAFFIGGEKILREVGWGGLSIVDYVGISLLQLTSLGEEFVVVFFVISGFAMANSVQWSSSSLIFFKKRIIRLWPTYLLACAIAVGVCGLELLTSSGSVEMAQRCNSSCTWTRFAALAFYIDVDFPNAPQFWSLPYEVLFYAICPIILRTRRLIFLTVCTSWIAGGIGAVTLGIHFLPAESTILNFIVVSMMFFSSGAAVYHCNNWIPKVPIWTFAFVTGGSLLAIVAFKFIMHGSNLILNIWMVGLGCFVIVNLPTYNLNLRRLNAGSWSYSIYLFHYQWIVLIMYFLLRVFHIETLGLRGYFWWTLAVPPVLAGCWVLYFVSERPCNEVLRKMRSRDRREKDHPVVALEPKLIEVGQ